jgi:salicylate hydroxylase
VSYPLFQAPHFKIQELNGTREDAWHLGQLFPTFTSTTPPATPPSADPLTSSKLKAIFEAFAQKRQPRTASVMNISRGIGELKCPTTPEGEKKRNEYFKAIGANAGATPKLQDDWFSQPF